MIPFVGIIRVLFLPFWDFIDFRSVFGSNVRFTTHTNRSGYMELLCRVPIVSLFPICKFPVFKDWIMESFGSIIFRDIPRDALMRLRSINVAVIFNTFFVNLEVFMYWWETECSFWLVKFHWIKWLASIHGWLFRSLYSIEHICSYKLVSPSRFTAQWPLRVALTTFVSCIATFPLNCYIP